MQALMAVALVFVGCCTSAIYMAKLPTRDWLGAMLGLVLIGAGQHLLT